MSYTELKQGEYTLLVYDDPDRGPTEKNVDIEVRLKTGQIYYATVFAVDGIHDIMSDHAQTGECLGGKYFYSVNMIIVREVNVKSIIELVDDLLRQGELAAAMGPRL